MSPPFVFVRVDYSADGDSLMSSKSSAPNVQSARVALYPGMPVSELLSILLTLFPQIPTNRRILGMEVNGEFIGIRSICTRPEALKSAESVQLVVEAGMFSDDPLSPYPYGFDLSSSTVVNVNSPEIVGDILASAGNKLVVIEFFRKQHEDCERLAPFYHFFSSKYEARAIFLDVDVEQFPELTDSFGISALPTYQFFIQGHRVTALEIPEPEHLESLVSIPFRSHFAEFDMSYESLHLDKSGIIEVLAKFIDAMIICPDPLLSENQACELKSRLEKEDPKLLEVYRKYTLHQDVSQLVIAILGVLDFSEEHTEVTLQEKCLKCIQSPPVSQFFAEKELHYIRILISEDHPQILLMFQKFSSDGQVNEFVTGLKKIISAGMSASLEGNNYQPNEIITFLKDLEVKKRLQTEEINILLELVSNEEPLIFAAYNSYLLDKDEDDFIETLSVMSKMQIMKPEAIDRILCQVEEDHQCFNENEMDILKTLIKDENDVTYAAFSLFLEDGDVNDLIETLQLLATQHSPLAVKSDVRGVKMRSMQISPLKIESEASQTTQSDEEEENEEEEDEDESNNGHDEDDDFDINAYSELSKTAQSDILKSLMAQPLTGLHEEDQIPE